MGMFTLPRLGGSEPRASLIGHGTYDEVVAAAKKQPLWTVALGCVAGTLVALLLLVVSLPPHRTRAHGALAGSTVLLLATVVVAICAVSAAAPCSAASLSFAQATSAAASLGAIVAFLPQIYETWRTRGRGSISYLSYFIQGLGCMVVMINMVVNNHDPWTVWMPGFVAGLGQLTIVVLGLGFLCRDRGRPLVAVADGGASLLQ